MDWSRETWQRLSLGWDLGELVPEAPLERDAHDDRVREASLEAYLDRVGATGTSGMSCVAGLQSLLGRGLVSVGLVSEDNSRLAGGRGRWVLVAYGAGVILELASAQFVENLCQAPWEAVCRSAIGGNRLQLEEIGVSQIFSRALTDSLPPGLTLEDICWPFGLEGIDGLTALVNEWFDEVWEDVGEAARSLVHIEDSRDRAAAILRWIVEDGDGTADPKWDSSLFEWASQEGEGWLRWSSLQVEPPSDDPRTATPQMFPLETSTSSILASPPDFWREFALCLRVIDPGTSHDDLLAIAVEGPSSVKRLVLLADHLSDEVRAAAGLST